jgi:hypothetical protein
MSRGQQHDVPHLGRSGRGDGVGGMVGADAWNQQEELVRAGEGGRERHEIAKIAGDAPGTPGQRGGTGGVADQDSELSALSVEFASELSADVPGCTGDQYHDGSIRSFAV